MINKKSKFKQLFCKHKNTGWFQKQEMFSLLNGEKHYHICKDCGAKLGTRFMEYEGMGYK